MPILACRYTIGGEHLILREKHMKTVLELDGLEAERHDRLVDRIGELHFTSDEL